MNKNLNDLQLINRIQSGDDEDECIKELVLRHSGIYLSIIHSYVPNYGAVVNKNDLLEDKEYHIYQAALKYDKDRKSKFSTFLGNETKWMCLNLHNKYKNKKTTPFEDGLTPNTEQQEFPTDPISGDLLKKILEIASSHPDKRVEKIFHMRYVQGQKNNVMPWRRISEALKMSIQGCINIHNAAILNIKQKLVKEV